MGTETRIGIVAGLLIVVVASVYFFYGNNRKDEEILVAALPRPAETVRIPIPDERKSAPARMPVVTPPRALAKATANQPPKPVSPAPAVASGPPAQNPKPPPVTPVGPPVDQFARAIDRNRLPVPFAPADSISSPPPTLLRTTASPQLVDATKDNLKPAPITNEKPKPAAAFQSPAPTPPPAFVTSVADKRTEPPLAHPSYTKPEPEPARESHPPKVKLAVQPVKTYTVEPGDTLYTIAKSIYGESQRWKEILQLNKDVLRNEPKRLKPGMVLKLPE